MEFDNLPVDADEQKRQGLAERMRGLEVVQRMRDVFPEGVYADAPRGADYAIEVAGRALVELYNAAQIDVLVRINPESRSAGSAKRPH